MPTTDFVTLSLCLLAGSLLGAFFFGGLWWTVRATTRASGGALLQVASLFARLGATLAGFFLVGAGDPVRMVACLGGFMIARWMASRWATARPQPQRGRSNETRP